MGTGWAAGGAPGVRRRLGEVLVAGKVLTDAQLNEALRVQREDKGRRRRLGEVITALGLADEVAIARALSDHSAYPSWTWATCPSRTRRWPCSPATSPCATARSR
jgi:hypothetical protein